MYSKTGLIRVVKMHFKEEGVDPFLELFEASKKSIRSFPGCLKMDMMRVLDEENTFITYSLWESEEDLNGYRKSDLFGKVWPLTKALFSAKAEAWSLSLDDMDPRNFQSGA